MHILGTGLTGLVGSRVVELLSPTFTFTNMSRSAGVDITDEKSISSFVSEKNPDIILHFAAATNVDVCEEGKILGEESEAWIVNVNGTKNVVKAAELIGKKCIYISTDFVFDGENPPDGGYTEEDIPSPVNWYGQTKYEGEKVVQTANIPWSILRIASPYRKEFEKKDFVRAILSRLQAGEQVKGVSDCWITPTFIDDIAQGIQAIITQEQTGIFHVVGSDSYTPYETAVMIAQVFEADESLIMPVSRQDFFSGRAKRPYKSILSNAKIGRLGVQMHTFEQGLEEIRTNS